MTNDILVVAEHLGGRLSDITFEMLGKAKGLAQAGGGRAIVVLIGGDASMTSELGAADSVVIVEGDGLSDFNPETYNAALNTILETNSPRLVIVGYTSMGMDLASTLAVTRNLPHATFCLDVKLGDTIKATSQCYGGKINVTTDLGAGPCVVSMLSGAASAEAGRAAGSPATETVPAPTTSGKIRFKRLIEPEAGDVDITTQEVLVAIGRGIGSKDDIEIAEELAEELDAAVAGSRPLIDAGWLPKTRQVGKSGLKVSPKLYLALGISGAPEHIEGMKSSATIVAINSDKHAPIFNVGMAADLFDVCEELTEALQERKG
jgi:electron transfer flavoprotein alpha subunit